VDTLGGLLRDAAAGTDVERIAARFDGLAVPASLAYALGIEPEDASPPLASDAAADRLPESIVVLAGPEVVRARAIDGLRAFASAANAPVANTWGAKGVLPWDSPHHMGTCGLQARDFELLGFATYDAIVATGIDADESPRERFALAPVVDVAPGALDALARKVSPSPTSLRPNDLYTRLAAIAQPGYEDRRVPLHPARAVADLRATLPAPGIVTADPGTAGVWVARTFPTTTPGTVVVPATVAPGAAAAIALVAARHDLPAIAATTEPLDHITLSVLELATELAAAFVVDVWGAGGPVRRASDHLDQLGAAVREPGVTIVDVPIDASVTRRLVDAAGPVVAWGGLPANSA
jgi:acetolactate synthase-1/2/3 large subunit